MVEDCARDGRTRERAERHDREGHSPAHADFGDLAHPDEWLTKDGDVHPGRDAAYLYVSVPSNIQGACCLPVNHCDEDKRALGRREWPGVGHDTGDERPGNEDVQWAYQNGVSRSRRTEVKER